MAEVKRGESPAVLSSSGTLCSLFPSSIAPGWCASRSASVWRWILRFIACAQLAGGLLLLNGTLQKKKERRRKPLPQGERS